MKLWIIIYQLGKIGGVIGPLPYDMVECEQRLVEVKSHTTPKDMEYFHIRIECEYHDTRPEMGD